MTTVPNTAACRVRIVLFVRISDGPDGLEKGVERQALDGNWHGGRAPYGYRRGDSTLYAVPEHAALIREATDRVLAGESLRANFVISPANLSIR